MRTRALGRHAHTSPHAHPWPCAHAGTADAGHRGPGAGRAENETAAAPAGAGRVQACSAHRSPLDQLDDGNQREIGV